MQATLRPQTRIVGRDAELDRLHRLSQAADAPRALLLSGEPGIGKTTLWEAGVDVAREQGSRVLSCRASGAEARLSFAPLIDLFDTVDGAALDGMPAPQRRALEVALLRAEPGDSPVETHAIAFGFLNALRGLASCEPVLVAIDDVQWLDRPSADMLAFAARRSRDDPIRFLLTRRPGRVTDVERALEPGLEHVDLSPLSLGAVRRLLSERLGLCLPRSVLRKLTDSTLGNPLFVLEVGQALVEQGSPAIGDEFPVPDAVEELLGKRVARLSAPVRRLLLAVALGGDLRASELARLDDPSVIEDGVDANVLVVEGDRVRPSHPLLAAVARKRSRPRTRRELHAALAEVVRDEELRALHVALATDRPADDLAAVVEAAAASASGRGARQEAVELGEHALRLTPPASPAWGERLLTLAGDLVLAGQPRRATELLAPAVESLPAGAPRARGWLLLAGGAVQSNADIERCFERALAESRDDPVLHSSVLAKTAGNTVLIRVARMPEAEAWASEALATSGRDPTAERFALYALAWARSMRGRAIEDIRERFAAVAGAVFPITLSPERVAGLRLVWRGEVDAARDLLTRLRTLADDRSEPYSYALLRLHFCQLESRIGNWDAVGLLLDEWEAEQELLMWPMYERCRALLAAGRGLPDEAERWSAETIARAEETGNRWDRLDALRARGTAALLAHDPARAVESLRAVWEHTEREGVEEPGVFPVAPDLVEALAELGRQDEAAAVSARLGELAWQHGHPWAKAAAKQCDAIVRLTADADDDEAVALLEQAAEDFRELGLRFGAARALLALGRSRRRRRKWAAARTALEQAAAAFDEMGSPGWAEDARVELARVGGRRSPASGALTPAEEHVVELAVEGHSNKEIAQRLVVTVNTVEVHLSRAYAKIGVHSRAQLARARSTQASRAAE